VGDWIEDLVWSPDSTQIASGGDWRSEASTVPFEVWEVDTGAQVAALEDVSWEETIGWQDGVPLIIPRTVDARDAEPRTLTVSADGRRMAQIRHEDGSWLDLLDVDGSNPVSLHDFVIDWRLSASFSPDGRYLAVSSASNSVKILDAQTGEVIAELPLIYSKAVAFSPDGLWLAVAESTAIQIYAVEELLDG
jgi:WD40 repeat protein